MTKETDAVGSRTQADHRPAGALRSRVYPMSSLPDPIREGWAELSEESIEPNPYLGSGFLGAAHRFLRPDVDPFVAVVTDRDRVLGILPFVEEASWHGLPITLRTTQAPLGSTMADLHTPLVSPTRPEETIEALLATAGRGPGPKPVIFEFGKLRLTGSVWDAMSVRFAQKGVTARVWDSGERGSVSVPSVGRSGNTAVEVRPEEVMRHLSSSRRRTIKKEWRALEADLGPLRWELRDDWETAVRDYVSIEAAGWKGTKPTGEGVDRVSGGREWFSALVNDLGPRGRLVVGQLSAGSQPVYLAVNLRERGSAFGLRDVYDERFAQYGPGTIGRLVHAWWFRHSGGHLFDSCISWHVYPKAAGLFPDRLPVGKVLVAHDVRARAALAAAFEARRRRNAATARRGGE